MILRYVTCSDPREHNSIDSIIELARMPHAEIAVQCHPSKMSAGMPRNVWFEKLLLETSKLSESINLAIHINAEWAYDICAHGKIPDLITEWLLLEKRLNMPLIQRVQLNPSKSAA